MPPTNAKTPQGVKVVRLADLRDQVTPIAPKYEGMVEQLICAGGRAFAGTPYSSYTAHILRLRRYIHAGSPDPQARAAFYHTQDNGNVAVVRKALDGYVHSFKAEVEMADFSPRTNGGAFAVEWADEGGA